MFKNDLLNVEPSTSSFPIFYMGELPMIKSTIANFNFTEFENQADIHFVSDGFKYSGNTEITSSLEQLEHVINNVMFFRDSRRIKNFYNSLSKAKNLITQEGYFTLYINFRELICDLYHQVTPINFIQELLKSSQLKSYADFKLLSIEESCKVEVCEDGIFKGSDFNILMYVKEGSEDSANSLAVFNLCLFEFLKNEKDSKAKNIEVTAEFNLILDQLSHPTVVLGLNGDILFFNEEFSKLSLLPSRISEFSEGDWFEHEKSFFQIKKTNIEEVGSIYVFYISSENSQVFIDHKKELGIITGSIAHELNNPVAGILAAISVLEFEEWSVENTKLLTDLKDSAIRCKELIDTFLGFSKYGTSGQSSRAFESIIAQSISLLRFRMIESGLKLDVDVDNNIKNIHFNSAVFSMVLYLILGELITIFSHQKLINQKLSRVLNIMVTGEVNKIKIKFPEITLSDSEASKFNQKLIQHLLEMDSMSLTTEPKAIYINF